MMNSDELVYAKSEPCQTIKEHTDALLDNLQLLREAYGERIENLVPERYRIIFWDVLSLVIRYHDLGKIHINFQNKIRKKISLPLLSPIVDKEIPHNLLSVAFFGEEIFEYEKDVTRAIIQAIVFHHEGKSLPNFSEIEKTIQNDLESRKELISDIVNPPACLWTGYERYYKTRITPNSDIYVFYLLLKGLLHRLDHASSAFTDIEIKDDSLPEKVLGFLSHKGDLRTLQQYALNNQDKNLVIVASTGIGKTEAGLLWAGREKTFFTLPLRVTVNSIFDRVANEKAINYKNTGLLHSTSLDYLDYAGYETPFEIYKNSRQLSCQVNISTIDQLFTFPFKYGGYEKIISTLLYSKVIIDEIQSYEPKIAAIILKGLYEIYKLGGKFLIMTATLPQIYLDCLKDFGVLFEYGEFLTDKKRHRIKVVEDSLSAAFDMIQTLAVNKKVLIIVNTVKQAKQVFRVLKAKGCFPQMLHSLYIAEDRKRLEDEICKFAERQGNHGVWITTQLAEASLDIDFDVLFTELSSLDSLFQRMGRVYRNREYDGNEPNVFVYTQDCSGIGSIYDREIFSFSKEGIKEFDGMFLQETDKVTMVKNIYNKEKLQNTKYYDEFEKALQILKNIMDYEFRKQDAHNILRDIYAVRIIPIEIYEKYSDEIMEKAKILKTSKNKMERLRAEQFINDKSMDISYFRMKQANALLTPINKLKGIYIANYKYCPHEGLLFDETVSNFI
ncbi:CRISPR-associated helicase Cas3' [Dissulfurispira sp.]|uniref:CRISPR-associated helicase Cas3' n=1 Tax=Dissulfurispira sp. TaxID=2817609 RepID=UPI002FD8B826